MYNTSTSSTNSSVDGYTIMSYFESGSTRGFYVLDLPDLVIPPKGFFVGSSAIPFSYQTTNNSTEVNYSWNDPLLTTKFGYIKKWVLANDNNNLDGNLNCVINNNSSTKLQIRILDQSGKLLLPIFYQTAKGENMLEIPETESLLKGFYYIEIGNTEMKKIIKAVKS